MNIKISVIIPVYNMGKYLPECLDSIVQQTLKEIEIIAVNDGSTDESLSILEKYSNDYDNIIVLTQRNQGAGPARNNGIQHAKGKYLIFIDPDDFYPNNYCLEALYNAAEDNNVLICGGIMVLNNEGQRTVRDSKALRDFYVNKSVKTIDYPDIYGHQKYLFRTDLIKENHIYFPAYKRFQDPPFTVKAMVCAGEFYGLDKEVYEHRVGHKKIKYSLENSTDILHGIRDVFKLAKENNLQKIYEYRLKNIYQMNIIPFYKYSFCGNKEIDEVIEEINKIAKDWIGDEEGIILTAQKVQQVRESSIKEYDVFMKILCDDRKKIFYGAGVKARSLIEQCRDKMQMVIGIAVTKKQDNFNNQLEGIMIKQIEEYLPYRENALVMITTIPAYQEEIETNLRNLGFKHILKLNMQKMELAEALREE